MDDIIFLNAAKMKAEQLGLEMEIHFKPYNYLDFKGGTDEAQIEMAMWLEKIYGKQFKI